MEVHFVPQNAELGEDNFFFLNRHFYTFSTCTYHEISVKLIKYFKERAYVIAAWLKSTAGHPRGFRFVSYSL